MCWCTVGPERTVLGLDEAHERIHARLRGVWERERAPADGRDCVRNKPVVHVFRVVLCAHKFIMHCVIRSRRDHSQ
jgi:hypothetical protein